LYILTAELVVGFVVLVLLLLALDVDLHVPVFAPAERLFIV
jgi:hypothetical protein